ncbi:MAG TPA: hypothetical protein GX520_11540 [Syntrophaceticus sp.]|nr:hypothetical protein [Syntrophaceticus sp.]
MAGLENISIKNSIYPHAGILSADLLKIAWGSNSGVMVDTENLLHTVTCIKMWSRSGKAVPANEEETKCLKRYGFFVHSRKVICPAKILKMLDLESQLIQINADRYQISGSNTVIADKDAIGQAEIKDTPFHRYLISSVMKRNPRSITVKCSSADGRLDPDVGLKSLRSLLELSTEKKLRGVHND